MSDYRIDLHHDDPWADTIILNGIRSFRLVIRDRYKTSHLSGDEWRYSYIWQRLDGEWVDLDGPYGMQDAAIAAFYPAFRSSHPKWCGELCHSIQFLWKGTPLAEMSDDGKSLPMLHAIGGIAWAQIIASERIAEPKDLQTVCCAHPGCLREPVSLYRKIKDYKRRTGDTWGHYKGDRYRRFCEKHLTRGDCGLDDADRNYEIVEGPGPNDGQPDQDKISPSAFGGVIEL